MLRRSLISISVAMLVYLPVPASAGQSIDEQEIRYVATGRGDEALYVYTVARIISTFLDDLRRLFRRACNNSRLRGEIRPDIDVDQVGDYLVGSVLGLWTLARSPAPPRAIAHYVEGVLAFVDGLRPSATRSRRRRRGRHSRDRDKD